MKNLLSLSYLLIPLLFFCCQPDDDDTFDEANRFCRDYPEDPSCPGSICYRVYPASSDFEIIDSVFSFAGDSTFGISVDTSYGSYLYFRVNKVDPRATYAWRVGSDPRVWTEPYVSLNWTGFEGTVDVSLDVTVEGHPCLTEEEMVSTTTTKRVTIVDGFQNYPVVGQFRGTLMKEGQLEIEDLTITLSGRDSPNGNDWFNIYGFPFPAECNLIIEQGVNFNGGYSWIISDTTPGLSEAYCTSRRPLFFGRLTPGDFDEITIDYWLNDDDGRRIQRQFVGRRVE